MGGDIQARESAWSVLRDKQRQTMTILETAAKLSATITECLVGQIPPTPALDVSNKPSSRSFGGEIGEAIATQGMLISGLNDVLAELDRLARELPVGDNAPKQAR